MDVNGRKIRRSYKNLYWVNILIMLKKFLHEPLLHFLLIGAALFVLYGLQNDPLVETDNRIVINTSDVDRLITLWEKKRQRPPTQTELDGMINAQVREEVLYREAIAMGLDKGDSIVRRRLAQKVNFIFSDLASLIEPSETELADYLAKNVDKFEIPSRISFLQIYLNEDKRGKKIIHDAEDLLDALTQQNSSIDILVAGDPFMFGQQHDNLTVQAVSRLFGKDFADASFKLSQRDWQGPIPSGYGLHLIKVIDKTPSRLPELNAIHDKVLNEWHTEQRRKMNEDFYQSLQTRYEIVIEKTKIKEKLASRTVAEIK